MFQAKNTQAIFFPPSYSLRTELPKCDYNEILN